MCTVCVCVCFLAWSTLEFWVCRMWYNSVFGSVEPCALNIYMLFVLVSHSNLWVKTLNWVNQMKRRRLWSCIFYNHSPTMCMVFVVWPVKCVLRTQIDDSNDLNWCESLFKYSDNDKNTKLYMVRKEKKKTTKNLREKGNDESERFRHYIIPFLPTIKIRMHVKWFSVTH